MKVLVACPIYVGQSSKVRENHEKIKSSEYHEIISLNVSGVMIQIARQIICEKFLETDAEYLLMLDDDVEFLDPESDPIDRLISLDKDIVGGIYVYKRKPHYPAFRPKDLQRAYEKKLEFPKDYKFKIPNKPFEVEWMSGGCILIKREIIEKLISKYDFPFCSMVYKKEFLSEDFAFCKRARDEGFEVWADPFVELGHVGDYSYTLKDYYED